MLSTLFNFTHKVLLAGEVIWFQCLASFFMHLNSAGPISRSCKVQSINFKIFTDQYKKLIKIDFNWKTNPAYQSIAMRQV